MRRTKVQRKNFRDLLDMFGEDRNTAGDVSLAGFLIEHGFTSRDTSVGLIGESPQSEVMALNALVSPRATLVALSTTTFISQHGYLANLGQQIEANGFELRLQLADLTLPDRWPNILAAMAQTDVGILGIDAHWAASGRGFWNALENFVQAGSSFVYLRNMLDPRHPEFSIPFIRSMPVDCTLDVVATTPASVWFASDPVKGASARELLRSSGLFARDATKLSASGDAPVVVTGEGVSDLISRGGHFPRALFTSNAGSIDGLNYETGWSNVEPDGCWTEAQNAVIMVTLPANTVSPTSLCISGNTWIPADVTEQVVQIGVGKEPTEWHEMTFVDPGEILSMTIDRGSMSDDPSTLIIHVKVRSPGRPSDNGESDSRLLGFKFRSLAVFT